MAPPRALPPAAFFHAADRSRRRTLVAAGFGVAIGVAGLVDSAPAAAQEVWRSGSGPDTPAAAVKETAPDPPAPGQAALERARSAWDKGDFDVAEPLYAEALEKGGLAPKDALEAYIHLGAARAVLGKKAGALIAFKSAALLDNSFVVPPEAGKRASALAAQARLTTKTGPLVLHAEVPDPLPPHTAAAVDVTLDAAHASIPGYRIGVFARTDSGSVPYLDSVRASRTAHFELPAAISLPSTTLRVRVDWMDGHANRLASTEEQIHVQLLSNTAVLPPPPVATTADGAPAKEEGKHRGFWHTAWPYVLGTIALAGGAVAIYFATRTPGDVNVTGVQVMTH